MTAVSGLGVQRFDEIRTMHSRILRGTLTRDEAAAVGARIAAVHRAAVRRPSGVNYHQLVDRNFESLVPLAGGSVTPLEWLGLQRFAAAFLISWTSVLEARAAAGGVIDGHGSLRPEHVMIDDGAVRIIDALPDGTGRIVDVADELGTMMMELQLLTGDTELGEAMLAGYHDADGGTHPQSLVAFFGGFRAQVRSRAALLRAADEDAPAEQFLGLARRLLTLSGHLNWQARGALVLLVSGPRGSGKSSLAAALGQASGLSVVSADARTPPSADAAAADLRPVIYAELAREALAHRAVIVEAEFGDPAMQRWFTDAIAEHPAGRPLVVECHTPTIDRSEQLRARAGAQSGHEPEDFSSMRGDVVGGYVCVDTRVPMDLQVDAVSSWLDSLLVTDRTA